MKPRTLTAQSNLPTAYEVAIDGVVVGYTARKTKSALLGYARSNSEMILSKFGDDEDFPANYSKAKGWVFGHVNVCFTGRTERTAASELNLI